MPRCGFLVSHIISPTLLRKWAAASYNPTILILKADNKSTIISCTLASRDAVIHSFSLVLTWTRVHGLFSSHKSKNMCPSNVCVIIHAAFSTTVITCLPTWQASHLELSLHKVIGYMNLHLASFLFRSHQSVCFFFHFTFFCNPALAALIVRCGRGLSIQPSCGRRQTLCP